MTKKNKLVRLITSLLVVLLIIGSVGVILHFLGIGKDDITDILNPAFRVEYDSEVYKSDTENIIALPVKGKVRFEVKGTSSYTVDIVPNVTTETDFEYEVDGIKYKYGEEKSLSSAFDLKIYDGAFTIDTDVSYALDNILLKLWGENSKVVIAEHGSFPAYKCVVISSTGEMVELLLCTCIAGITLPENIVF